MPPMIEHLNFRHRHHFNYRAGARRWYKRQHSRLLRRLAKAAIRENDNPVLVTRAIRGYAD